MLLPGSLCVSEGEITPNRHTPILSPLWERSRSAFLCLQVIKPESVLGAAALDVCVFFGMCCFFILFFWGCWWVGGLMGGS